MNAWTIGTHVNQVTAKVNSTKNSTGNHLSGFAFHMVGSVSCFRMQSHVYQRVSQQNNVSRSHVEPRPATWRSSLVEGERKYDIVSVYQLVCFWRWQQEETQQTWLQPSGAAANWPQGIVVHMIRTFIIFVLEGGLRLPPHHIVHLWYTNLTCELW